MSHTMPETLRTFLAIPISQRLLDTVDGRTSKLAQLRADLRGFSPAVRVTEPRQLHVTVKFLGNTSSELLNEIFKVTSEVAELVTESQWQLRGVGVFPNLSHPTVVWIGLEPADGAHQIAALLEAKLEPLGFPPERRPFNAHVTVGYIKARPPKSFVDLVKRHEQTVFGTDRISQIDFIESKLLPNGSQYRLIESMRLSSVRR
jgi:2'-5' RNA ligase